MQELFVLVVVVLLLMVATAYAARAVGKVLLVVENVLVYTATAITSFVMLFVGAEVLMRYAFNSPIPGHLEGSELLMPLIVFLAISYTQATNGHVGMDLFLDSLSPRIRKCATIGTLLLSLFVCAILAWFSFKNAVQLWRYDDVTMTPPYFRTWPAGASIALGYALVALRMHIQLLNLYDPDRFPANAPKSEGFHAVE